MPLRSLRLSLSEITWDDVELIHDLNSRPESDRYNTLGIPADMEVTRQTIAPDIEDQQETPRTKYCWLIRDHAGQFIGKIGMNIGLAKYCKAEIYYVILPELWGQGFATESVRCVIDFGFEQLGLHRIEAGVATENSASIRVLEKVGMTREGIGRKILPIRGQWFDNYSYSILEDDPRN